MGETDKELLELAAKAAKLEIHWGFDGLSWAHATDEQPEQAVQWNPLHDDGDAMRLAVKLCMFISTGPCMGIASTIKGSLRGFRAQEETVFQDQMEAVRRAIVRAAAETARHTEGS